MEAAGFVLGVYPAVSLIFDQYQDAWRFAKHMKGFQRTYRGFVMDIQYQQAEFENVLYNLMCCGDQPFIPGDISKDKFLDLIQDYDKWNDIRLHLILKRRLGRRYEFVLDRISGVWQDFRDLEELLLVDKLRRSTKTEDWWRAQWKKIKLVLDTDENKEKYRILGDRIEQLKKILESCDREAEREQERSPQLSRSSIRDVWTKTSASAHDLYEAIRIGWRCHCNSMHRTMLGLHSLTFGLLEGPEKQFDIIFELPSGDGTTRDEETLTSLKCEICIKCVKILTTEASSYLPSAISLPDSQALLLRMDSGNSVSSTNESIINDENVALTKVSKRGWLKQSISRKFNRGEFIHQVRLLNHRQAFTVTRQTVPNTQQLLSIESSDTSTALPSPPIVSAPNVSASNPQLGSTAMTETTMIKITNLCDSLTNATNGDFLGYLFSAKPSNGYLHLLCQSINDNTNIATRPNIALTDLLNHQRGKFLPRERASVALTIAVSTLYLHQTQWVDQSWGKDDILFRTNGENIQYGEVYIAKDFPSFTSTPLAAEEESQNVTAKIMRLRNSFECLGIVLAELCLGFSLSSCPEFEDFRGGKGKQVTSPTHKELSEFVKELSTLETVQSTEPLYYTAMENCLSVRNLGAVRSMLYEDVMQQLWDDIIQPLEELNSKWKYIKPRKERVII